MGSVKIFCLLHSPRSKPRRDLHPLLSGWKPERLICLPTRLSARVTGFAPATSCSTDRRSRLTELHPHVFLAIGLTQRNQVSLKIGFSTRHLRRNLVSGLCVLKPRSIFGFQGSQALVKLAFYFLHLQDRKYCTNVKGVETKFLLDFSKLKVWMKLSQKKERYRYQQRTKPFRSRKQMVRFALTKRLYKNLMLLVTLHLRLVTEVRVALTDF